MTAATRGALSRIVIAASVLAMTASACRPTERFRASSDGVVSDAALGVEWTSRDHDEALPWDAADRWCRDLALAGRDDWRLPEVGELRTLYDPERDEPCGTRRCRLDKAIRIRAPYVWTATERGVGARFYVDLAYGNELSPSVAPELVRRVLCVRGTGSPAPSARADSTTH
jgi:hypothetical protein